MALRKAIIEKRDLPQVLEYLEWVTLDVSRKEMDEKISNMEESECDFN